jgi:hypothetical protein
MTIGAKKLAEIIQREVTTREDLSPEQRHELAELCQRIYATEASASSGVSAQRLIESIRTDISSVADRLNVGRK